MELCLNIYFEYFKLIISMLNIINEINEMGMKYVYRDYSVFINYNFGMYY